jgi:hypothetical protein
VTAATITNTIQVPPSRRIEALRLLVENMEFLNHESQVWKMVLVVLECERASTGLCTSTKVSEWVLDTFLDDLRASRSASVVAWLLTLCLESPNLLRRVLNFSGDMVNFSVVEGDYTLMHGKIAKKFSDAVVPGTKLLLQEGTDPHYVGITSSSYGGDNSRRLDTPTSLTMRKSSFVFRWRQLVHDVGYEIDKFVADEMDKALLVASGWTVSSLTQLFKLYFTPLELRRTCTQFGRLVYHKLDHDELWWEGFLDQLKDGEEDVNVDDTFATLEYTATGTMKSTIPARRPLVLQPIRRNQMRKCIYVGNVGLCRRSTVRSTSEAACGWAFIMVHV